MYKSNKNIETPNGNTIIWRYMSIDKFLHLITAKQLFFCRLSKMTDRFEGRLPKDNYTSRISQIVQSEGISALPKANKERIEIEKFKDQTYINCWTISREESYALWKIYLRGSSCGIAIKSTVSKLRKSIELESKNVDFLIGKVIYTKFLKDYPPPYEVLTTTKSPFYDYEKELRVFFKLNEIDEEKDSVHLRPGWNVKLDITELIDRIYISPFIGKWFYDSLIEILTNIDEKLADLIEFSKIEDE